MGKYTDEEIRAMPKVTIKAKADWYDPTVAAKDEFFGEREHEKSKEQKKLEKRYYW